MNPVYKFLIDYHLVLINKNNKSPKTILNLLKTDNDTFFSDLLK
jgi:hypothetical protein